MRPDPQRILDYREFPVLCVDDEPENLRILELGLRREFSILTARSGEDALRIFNERPIAVVLSDQRMPGMSGVDLLARVRELDPRAIRVLVTAFGDAETLSRAVNDSSIYRYVPKPWNLDEMRMTLRRAIEVYALEGERESLLQELTALSRVSHSINQQPELEPLLDLILDMLTREFGYDGATLFFFDDRGARLSAVRASPAEGEVAEWLADFAVTGSDAPKCLKRLRDGEVQTLALDAALDLEPAVRRFVMEVSADEILVVPLIGRQAVIGALAVDNRRGGGRFRVQDRTLLEGLTTQVVTAIENARLVAELRRARERMQRADRKGAVGALAAGLARAMREPLETLHAFLAQAPARGAGDSTWTARHGRAAEGADRVREIAAAIERLSGGGGPAAREICHLPDVIAEAVREERPIAEPAGVEIEIACDAEIPKVLAAPDQLRFVVGELLRNAVAAARRHVGVRLRAGDGAGLRAEDGAGLRAGNGVRRGMVALEVGDDGPGMPAEQIERIFDPFHTGGEPDAGGSPGLAACDLFVTSLGGTIEVRSRPDQGTAFCVRLPAGEPE